MSDMARARPRRLFQVTPPLFRRQLTTPVADLPLRAFSVSPSYAALRSSYKNPAFAAESSSTTRTPASTVWPGDSRTISSASTMSFFPTPESASPLTGSAGRLVFREGLEKTMTRSALTFAEALADVPSRFLASNSADIIATITVLLLYICLTENSV